MGSMFDKAITFLGFEVEEEFDHAESRQTSGKKSEKVVKFDDIKKRERNHFASAGVEHILLAPKQFEDAKRIADEIKSKKIVTLNMENVSIEVGRRILDFISGTAYAVNARIAKISDDVFISDPSTIQHVNELPVKESSNEILEEQNRQERNEQEEITRKFAR
ncbi:MAG: cell division protein SepF [Fusobacteriota bacterium]